MSAIILIHVHWTDLDEYLVSSWVQIFPTEITYNCDGEIYTCKASEAEIEFICIDLHPALNGPRGLIYKHKDNQWVKEP